MPLWLLLGLGLGGGALLLLAQKGGVEKIPLTKNEKSTRTLMYWDMDWVVGELKHLPEMNLILSRLVAWYKKTYPVKPSLIDTWAREYENVRKTQPEVYIQERGARYREQKRTMGKNKTPFMAAVFKNPELLKR